MTILLIAEHDNTSLKTATLNAASAAAQLGGDITVLVAGHNCAAAAQSAAAINGVTKVLLADDAAYAEAHQVPFAERALQRAGGAIRLNLFDGFADEKAFHGASPLLGLLPLWVAAPAFYGKDL